MRKPSVIFVGISTLLLALFSAGCGSTTPTISITLTPSVAQTIDQGQSINITAALTNDSSNKGVSWSVSGSGSLANQTTTSVTYDAPTSVTSQAKATVTATSVAQTAQTAALSIVVNAAPTITSTSLSQGTAGTAYNFTLTETGGTAPYTWAVTSGQVPPGLSLNTAGGVISGTPTGAGTFTFTVELSDAANLSTSESLSIVILPPPALAITTTALPNGALNLSYTAALTASGGVPPYKWSIFSGTLPAGLNLGASGVISGTPTATGTSTFTVQLSDSEVPTPATVTQSLSITINPVPFSITTTSLPSGTIGIGYSTTLQVSGGVPPLTWSISSGSLPSWATLNAATGVISGTPTATGTSNFTVQVVDAETPTAAIATQPLSITVNATQNGFLTGQYAFVLGSYRGGLAGSFTADGKGNITGGIEDLEDVPHALSATDVAITSGTYAVGTDYRGTLTYTDANNNTFTFDLALSPLSAAVAAKGAMIEVDATGNNFTGSLDLQNTSAFSASAMSGGYAFGLTGWDATGNTDVIVGSATVSSGSVTAGLLDENDAGTLTSSQAFTGTLSVDSSGRGTFASSTSQGTFTFYVVSATKWLAIAIDTTTGVVRTGVVEQQGIGLTSASTISGTMVLQSESANSVPSPQAMVGLLTSPGDGTAAFSFDVNDGGTVGALTGTGALTFSSGTNGRFTLTLQSTQSATHFVGYMVAVNTAFIAGTDSIPSFGRFDAQSSGPFTNSSLNGSYYFGSQPLVAAPAAAQPPLIASGEMTFDGSGALSGTTDSQQAGTVTTSQVTGTYTVGSTGRVTLVPGTAILYIVSPSKAAALYIGQAGFPNPFVQVVQR